jgi:hypothetical protein
MGGAVAPANNSEVARQATAPPSPDPFPTEGEGEKRNLTPSLQKRFSVVTRLGVTDMQPSAV